jgi:virginiamycin B lyase
MLEFSLAITALLLFYTCLDGLFKRGKFAVDFSQVGIMQQVGRRIETSCLAVRRWVGIHAAGGGRRRAPRSWASAAAALCVLASPAGAAAQTITEFPIPNTGAALAGGITAGPDGALWFAEDAGVGVPPSIGRITLGGQITSLPLPMFNGSSPTGDFAATDSLVTGPDGALWFTDLSHQIGRITIDGSATGFAVPTVSAITTGITVGSDGALWFSEASAGKVGRITTGGGITEFPTLNPTSVPVGITKGPDGAIWFADFGAGAIGTVGSNGAVTLFPVTEEVAAVPAPTAIVTGPDGALWFTDGQGIGRITTAGEVTHFLVSLTHPVEADGIALASDGALWFTDSLGNAIGRITTDGIVSEFPVPTEHAFETSSNPFFPNQIVAGPDGALWFAESGPNQSGANQIGRLAIVPSPLAASVLPSGRSVQIGTPATIFATVINTADTALAGCSIALPNNVALLNTLFLTYQTTNPQTNAPTGRPNTPVTIPGNGGVQTFILTFTVRQPLAPQTVALDFSCTGAEPAAPISGVSTVDLSFSAMPVPDVIAEAATATNDQTLHLANDIGAFAMATADVGAAATLTVTTDTGSATLPLSATLCQTTASGQCLAPPAASLQVGFQPDATPTFSIFVSTTSAIPFAPGASRLFVRFKDASGASHGATSVAVTTD